MAAAAVAALALLAPACSDDEGDVATDDTEASDESTDTTAAEGTTDTTAADDGGGGACGEQPFTGTISRLEDEMSEQPATELADTDIVEATGSTYSGGAGYTVYLSDAPIEGQVGLDTITAPEGGVMVTISFAGMDDAGEPIAAGAEVGAPQAVIIDTGGGASVNSTGAEGSVSIIDVSDTEVCFDISYTDDYQTVEGTVSASLVEASF
jgi:hypothetical protein